MKGTLKNGFQFEIPDENMNNMELETTVWEF